MSEEKMREIRISIPEELLNLFVPEKILGHFLNAKKELLLGLRSMIDFKIEAMEKREKKKAEKGRKVKVE
jgi:hypothetical protein